MEPAQDRPTGRGVGRADGSDGELVAGLRRAGHLGVARCEARIQLLTEYLTDAGGDLDDDGGVRAAADLLTRLESQAMNHRARIGLDPLSRARLGP